MNTSHKFIQWGGLLLVCVVAWQLTGSIDHNTANLLLGLLFGVFFAIMVLVVAFGGKRERVVTIYREREPSQTPTEQRTEPKRLQAQPTRYTVVTEPQAKLPQARGTIGTKSQKRIEVRRWA